MCNRTRRRPQNRTKYPCKTFFKFDSKSSRELRGQVCEKKSPFSTVSTLRFRPPALQKGLSQKDAERKEGRCRKILQLQKFRKEGERKKFRGSLSAENAEWEGAGGGRMRGAHRLPTFWGRNGKGDGGRRVAWRPPPRPRLRFSQICGLLRQQ